MDWDESGDEEANAEAIKGNLKACNIRVCNFSDEQKFKALQYSLEASAAHKMDKDMASEIKRKLDADELFSIGNGAWQIIVGRSFGLSITHETKLILFFDILTNKRSVLMFRTQ